MKTATANYNTERVKLQTSPIVLVRFSHVKTYGAATAYAFRTQFATAAVVSSSRTTLLYLGRVTGGRSAVTPEQGRATVGGYALELVDVGGEVTRYLSAPALTLKTAMTAGSPGAGGYVEVNEATSGMPAEGTLEVTTGGVIERVRYDLRDDAGTRFRVATAGRGADGTTAAAHSIGDAVTNGEQIRAGQRVQLLVGYAPLAEADYMAVQTLEVVSRALAADGVTWVIQCQDVQRALRSQVFLTATKDAPVLLSGNPVDLALQVLTSTGVQGANGTDDLLAVENGLGVPVGLVDVTGLRALRDAHFAGQVYRYKITEPAAGKDWLEALWKALNCYPVVTQDGQYTARRYQPAPAPGAVTETLTDTDLISAEWISGDPMMINRVLVQWDWDLPSAPGQYGTRRFYLFADSIARHGPRPVLTLMLDGVRGDGSPADDATVAMIDDRAYTIGKRFAEPPAALRCRVFYRKHPWEVGDLVKLTYSLVPNLKTGLRGLTNEVFEIVDLAPHWPPEGGYLELTLLHTGAIALPAAPTAGPLLQAARRGVAGMPPRPGGLELMGQGNDAAFTGREVRLRWNRVSLTPSSGIDEDNFASQSDSDLTYAVTILVGGVAVRRAVVTQPEYAYTWEQNVEDNGASGARALTVEMRTRNNFLESEAAVLVIANAAPDMSAVTPTLTQLPEGVLVDWSAFAETDPDFDHYAITYGIVNPPTTPFGVRARGQQNVLLPNLILGGAAPLYVRITPYDAFGAGTVSATASSDRVPPAPTGLAATVGTGKAVSLDWTDSTEPDFSEYGVYRHTADVPASAVKIAEVRASRFVDAEVTLGTAYWYWVTAIDRAENESAKSSSVTATPTTVVAGAVDSTAPSQPGTFAKVAEGTYLAGDGSALAYLDITLPAMPTGGALLNLLYKATAATPYLLAAQSDAGAVTLRIDDLTPGRQYDVAVQAVSRFGTLSTVRVATSSPFTAPGDTTAPGAPSAIAVRQGGGKLIEIDLTFSEPADWATVELYRNTTDNSGSATLIETKKAKRFHDQNVSYGTTYYYWAKVVDLSGNKSGFSPSSGHSVAVATIATGDVAAEAITQIKSVRNDSGHTVTNDYADVDSVTITTTGGIVLIWLGWFCDTDTAAINGYRIMRDSTVLVEYLPLGADDSLMGFDIDAPAAGTYTYKWQAEKTPGATVTASKRRLLVMEIKR